MPNIYGPFGAGVNETVDRPGNGAPPGNDDTWFQDCVGGVAGTGTKPPADWFNKIAASLRRAIRGMGVPEDPIDDDMLLKAIQAAQVQNVINLASNVPVFPEILTVDGRFAFTTSTGQIVIPTGQSWQWRALKTFITTDFDAASRTFNTSASKTYHLRWYKPGHANAPLPTWPNGRFMLRDLADAAYNPTVAVETSTIFDTSYDDMLLARVVTSVGNALTVTALVNKATLRATGIRSTFNTDPDSWTDLYNAGHRLDVTLNWSRTPQVNLGHFSVDATLDSEAVAYVTQTFTRYSGIGFTAGYKIDGPQVYISGQLTLEFRA